MGEVILFIVFIIFILPIHLAFYRSHHQRWAITWTVILLWWVPFVWVAALIWSLTAVHHPATKA